MDESQEPKPTEDSSETPNSQMDTSQIALQAIRDRVTKIVIGQDQVVDEVLQCFISGGHVLVEGVPGLAKTLLVRALARCFDGAFQRIQFTPDLMPSDVTGHSLYNMKEERFETRKGPIFTNLLLADEINRAPAKTQSALLEVMQERRVTINLDSFSIAAPFMVLATQNPIEQDGTYPLPEAQLDRFMLKVLIDYPDQDAEARIATDYATGAMRDDLAVDAIDPCVTGDEINSIKEDVIKVKLDPSVVSYAVDIARRTRDYASFAVGAGPRATLAMIRLAQAAALMSQRDFVIPDDIKQVAIPVLRHRVTLTADLEIEGTSIDEAIAQMLSTVDAPRQ